jgi:hypothetical protein
MKRRDWKLPCGPTSRAKKPCDIIPAWQQRAIQRAPERQVPGATKEAIPVLTADERAEFIDTLETAEAHIKVVIAFANSTTPFERTSTLNLAAWC